MPSLCAFFVVIVRLHVSTRPTDREQLLTASLKNLANCTGRAVGALLPLRLTRSCSQHATLLFDLAHNLHRRNEAKRGFDRGASARQRLALESASLIHEVVRHADAI